jgi:hypothetical protein
MKHPATSPSIAGILPVMRICLAVVLLLTVACSKGELKPGERELQSASHRISGGGKQEPVHGNTNSAKRRAKAVADAMTELDRALFSGQDENKTFSQTESFLVYCRHGLEGVAFLIHVPQFKRYKDDVRQTLIEAAWAAARAATADLGDDIKLGVGLRGSVMYGATAVGTRGGTPAFDLGASVDLDPLFPFFIGRAPPEAEDPPPPEPEKAAEPPPEPPQLKPPPPPPKLYVRTESMQYLAPATVDEVILKTDFLLQKCGEGLTAGSSYEYTIAVAGDGKVKKLTAKTKDTPAALTKCLTKIAAKEWGLPKKQLGLTKPETGTLRFAYQPDPPN